MIFLLLPILRIDVQTLNDGTGTSGPAYLGYYLSENSEIITDDYRIAEDYISSLAPNRTEHDCTKVNLEKISAIPDLPDGTHTYYIGFILDYKDDVVESNEDDNKYYFTPLISFTRGTGENKPDLIVEYVAVFDSKAPDISFSCTIKNQGEAAVTSAFRNRAYLSDDTSISTSDYRIHGWNYDSGLSIGESVTSSTFNVSLSGIPEETYYLGVLTDSRNAISESNESNNTGYDNSPRITIGTKKYYIAAQLPDDQFGPPPIIDGYLSDPAWLFANPAETLKVGGVANVWNVPWTNFDDNRVQWRAVWSAATNKLYVGIQIWDDVAGASDHDIENLWQDDDIEIYVDGDRSGGDYIDNNSLAQQWLIRRDNTKHLNYTPGEYTGSAIESAVWQGSGGRWNLEVAMEIYDQYNAQRKQLKVDGLIGWDVWYDDSDNEQQDGGLYLRDHQVGWGYAGPAWTDADHMQELEFGPVPSGKTIVRIQLDMTHEIHNVNAGDFVGVRGNLAPMSWLKTVPMWDDDGDNIYVIDLDYSGITPNVKLEYKFVHHAPPLDNNSEDVVWEHNPGSTAPYFNRETILTGASQIFPVVFWENKTGSFWADVDEDGDVDVLDIQQVAAHWNTKIGDPDYDPLYDVDNEGQGDGDIDILDIQLVASWWNKSIPPQK